MFDLQIVLLTLRIYGSIPNATV